MDYIFTTKEARAERQYGAIIKNVLIENVFYQNWDNDFATAIDLDLNREEFRADDLVVRNAFLGNCKNIFHMACRGEVEFSSLRGTYVKQKDGVLKR